MIGTIKFLSVNTHNGFEHGRRDDLEAVGRVLIFFMKKGSEPGDAVNYLFYLEDA